MVQSLLMRTDKKTHVIEYTLGILAAVVLTGCGASQTTVPPSETDLIEAVGEEQASLMAEYELMEAQDNAAVRLRR